MTIAIIGGGVSGTLTAFHLIQQKTPAEIILIDQRPNFGLGLAYSTPSLRHLLNVPAGKISALPEQPHHFLSWLQSNYDPSATEHTFAPRAIFGRYIQSLLAQVKGIRQAVASVIDLRPGISGATLILDDGREIRADRVVLATGNFEPAPLPGVAPEAIAKRLYHHNAWSPETYSTLFAGAPVAIIGTGLTGVDVVLRLRELGHRGKIIAISRHGMFPNRHAHYAPLEFSAIPLDTSPNALAYLQALRKAIEAGADWRAAVDSLRNTTNELWLRLPLRERRRVRRHLQRRWEVVRHRMAPPVAAAIDSELANNSLEIHEGRLVSIDATAQGSQVTLQTHDGSKTFCVERVINCTGPNMNYRRVESPLLRKLFDEGIATAGAFGTGFHCAENGALIDATGKASRTLFNLGPGRLGDLFESIAIPEIRKQAVDLAETVMQSLRRQNDLQAQTGSTPAKTAEEPVAA